MVVVVVALADAPKSWSNSRVDKAPPELASLLGAVVVVTSMTGGCTATEEELDSATRCLLGSGGTSC